MGRHFPVGARCNLSGRSRMDPALFVPGSGGDFCAVPIRYLRVETLSSPFSVSLSDF
jgi:hypothetical protein